MYNEERKLAYLTEKQKETIMSTNIEKLFRISEKMENETGKDMCEWNTHQILDFYKYYSTHKIQTLILIHNQLTSYADWCLINGLVKDNQNHYREIGRNRLVECLDIGGFADRVFTRSQLLIWLNETPNNQDRFAILGLFEGITMKDHNLVNVRLSDFSCNTLTLSNGNKIDVSNDLLRFAFAADEENEYIFLSNRGWAMTGELVKRDTILKPYIYNGEVQDTYPLWIANRMRKFWKYIGVSAITIKDTIECGRLWYLSRRIKEINMHYVEEYLRVRENREKCEKIYGKIQNISSYMDTYAPFVELYK